MTRQAHSLLTVALGIAVGFLAGVVLVIGLQKTPAPQVRTRTVTVTREVPATRTTGGTVVVRTLVPTVVGEQLDTARARIKRAGFKAQVDSGGGLFGVIVASHWQVVAQDPAPGRWLERGSTIHLDIARR